MPSNLRCRGDSELPRISHFLLKSYAKNCMTAHSSPNLCAYCGTLCQSRIVVIGDSPSFRGLLTADVGVDLMRASVMPSAHPRALCLRVYTLHMSQLMQRCEDPSNPWCEIVCEGASI